jgi:SAM-dependent methyltransferase
MTLRFVDSLQAALAEDTFRKVTLGKFRGELAEVEHVYVRKVVLKEGERFSFVYRYPDRDVTQNHTLDEMIALLAKWLGNSCLSASLFTSTKLQQLSFNRRGKPRWSSGPADIEQPGGEHDRSKNRLLTNEEFLKPLGILDSQGKPKMQMGDKYRQIHHFVDILAPAIRSLTHGARLQVVDVGSGKGYLTFAIYAYLRQENFHVEVLGVELRKPLVDLCSRTAEQCGFEHLKFAVGDISTADLESIDVLVALHACDTATDEAIYQGITAGAQLILVAPCCHKELRPQLSVPDSMKPLFKHGIQIDRMSEAITDALRAMYLEASGYVTRIQEFVALEHTMKNLLIVASKNSRKTNQEELMRQAAAFGEQFGIRHQRLADLLTNKNSPNEAVMH